MLPFQPLLLPHGLFLVASFCSELRLFDFVRFRGRFSSSTTGGLKGFGIVPVFFTLGLEASDVSNDIESLLQMSVNAKATKSKQASTSFGGSVRMLS